MTNCPCCSQTMLRHIRHNHVYWFCRNCWSEMPLLDLKFTHLGLSSFQKNTQNNRSLSLA
ncbi:MAG TPA: hypothetical protein V6C58_11745 [Allocoleopsis sp.]